MGHRNLPSHALLRSFECAARHGSCTNAAEELQLTQSAVSRQIKELEDVIGVALFRRVGRRMTVTEAGRRFAADLAVDLENIRQSVVRAVATGEQNSLLRVAVLPTFASRWLIPRLAEFSKTHPNIELRLETRTVPFDLSRERFDVAIHFGKTNWPDARTSKLFDEEMLPVASPKFRDSFLTIEPIDLASVPLLHLITRESAWNDWFALKEASNKVVTRGRYFDQFSMIVAAAASSLGAALLPKYLIETELEKGILIPLSNIPLKTRNTYFVVSPAGKPIPQVKAFTYWLTSNARRAKATIAPTEP